MADGAIRLGRAFFERPTVEVAIALLGAVVVRASPEGVVSGRIVETEAYGDGGDLASHAARLKRGGVLSMRGEAGIAYVYRSYGIHAMLNVVAKPPGATGAVLIRALEPVTGVELMRARRSGAPAHRLASGPGNLCRALGISLADHGLDVTTSADLRIEAGEPVREIVAGERIGVSRATDLPWRFFDANSASVSAHRRGVPLALPVGG